MANKKTIGIIGGVGPLATAYFMERIVTFTDAFIDQDHIDMIVLNHCSIPDRTAYILDQTKENPIPFLIEDAKKLEGLGVDFIVTPCNTAHFFYDIIKAEVSIPIINMVNETVEVLKKQNSKRVGIMATKGTIKTGLFQKQIECLGLNWEIPDDYHQDLVTRVIFDQVKANKKIDLEMFNSIVKYFIDLNCDRVILGCTELSIVKKNFLLDEFYLDSLDVLAVKTIELYGVSCVDNYINRV